MPDASPPTSSPARTVFAVLVLLGLLVLTIAVTWWAWSEIGEVEFSTHGLVALGLGVGLTLLCGGGLMALIFYSSRRGYDERAHDWSGEQRRRRESERPPHQP